MNGLSRIDRLDLVFWGAAAVFLAVHIWIVLTAGFTFPTPWPDEAHFLWQAHAFSKHFTLFAPELNTDRMILWIPPGYLVVVGTFFKLAGSSLSSARLLSLLFMIPAVIMLLRFLAGLTSRWWALGFWGLFIINARFIACSNIARMEALLLLMIAGAFLLLLRGRLTWGLLLLLFSPLVHFNGFLFLVFGLAYAYYQHRAKNGTIEWNRLILSATALLVVSWMGYALLAFSNWSAFASDMAFQFGRKGNAKPWSFLTTRENLLFLILLVIVAGYAVKNKMKSVELVFLAVPAWLTWRIGHELWYEVLYHVGFLASSLLILGVWIHLVKTQLNKARRWQQVSATLGFVVLLYAWNYRLETIEDMGDYPWSLDLQTMHYTANVPYTTADEKVRLLRIIEGISGGREITVQFSPAADAFILLPASGNNIENVCPLFQERTPDLFVVHYSRNLPGWWNVNDYILGMAGVSRDSTDYIGLYRSGTEQWYIVPSTAEMRAKLHSVR